MQIKFTTFFQIPGQARNEGSFKPGETKKAAGKDFSTALEMTKIEALEMTRKSARIKKHRTR